MVSFRGREADFADEPDVNVDIDGRTGWIQAQIRPLDNCIRSIVESKIDFSIQFNVSQQWDVEYDLPNMVEITAKQMSKGGPLNLDADEGEQVGEAEIFLIQEGEGIKISLRADVAEDMEDPVTDDTATTEQEFSEEILGYIRDNPAKAALGYGPTHSLDNIGQVSFPKDYNPTSIEKIIDDFEPWIAESLRRTEEKRDEMHPEHGFYLDSFNNVVGIYEGKMTSIKAPPRDKENSLVTVHTHPSIESAPVPSTTDIHAMADAGPGTYHIIANGAEHTQFRFERESFEDFKSDMVGRETMTEEELDAMFRPMSVAPVLGIRVADIDDIGPVDDYLDSYSEYMINHIGIQMEHKVNVVEGLKLANSQKDMVLRDIKQSAESMMADHEESVDDSRIMSQVKAAVNTFDVGFMFNRDFVKYRDIQ